VLNALQQQYAQAVNIIGIIPGKTYTVAMAAAFSTKYKTVFTLFIDPAEKLTRYLQATTTPEVILLNEQYELVYKGAIDNSIKELGMQRNQATENYLSNAITLYLQHKTVAVKRRQAIGCLINDF